MTLAIAIVLGIVGVGAAVFGLGYYIAFRIGLAMFERSLKTEVAQYGKDQVEAAAMKIRNPMVRRIVSEHLVGLGGAAAVSMVRNVLTSRMRTGMYIAVAGVIVLIASFYTGSWLPMIWKTA
jgi:NAD(P)-dependent dehydrogenase (short-subunit alcohol dehydrogenase family)